MFYLFQSSVAASVFMCKLQVFYLDVVYVFTHMLQVNAPNVSSILDKCYKSQTYVLIVLPLFQYVATSAAPHAL
jgi:hypothetical protein